MALCSYWCVVNEAWCWWGAAWGDVVRAADPLCRSAFEADGGRIYHEAWCGWGAAWGDSHLGRAQSRLRARPHRASCSRHSGMHSGLIITYSRVNSLRD